MRAILGLAVFIAGIGCGGGGSPTADGVVTNRQPAERKTDPPKATPRLSGPDWSAVVVAAGKRADIVALRGKAEKLQVQAILGERSALALGLLEPLDRQAAADALIRVRDQGIDKADPRDVATAERIAPTDVAYLREEAAPTVKDAAALKTAVRNLVTTPLAGDVGVTEQQVRNLTPAGLTRAGVAMAFLDRAKSLRPGNVLRAQEAGLRQFALATAIEAGSAESVAQQQPSWYLERRRAGHAKSAEQEGIYLVRVWSVSAFLTPTHREAFHQRLTEAASRPGFREADIADAAVAE